jgi:type III pantothenate kinase
MILAIDVGNTNIVLGCMDDKKIYFTSRFSTDRKKTSDEYAALLQKLFEINKYPPLGIEGSIISSVVPELSEVVYKAIKTITGQGVVVVDSGIKTGLNILYDNPAQLGSDRVADAVAACEKYPKPTVIFDMGTATTVSVLNASGSYVGGMIIPGVRIALEALSKMTSQLPHIRLEATKKVIATNTIDCMKSGSVYGNAAMVDGLIDRFEEELGAKAAVVATGGMMSYIIPHCRHEIICDADLTLRGLYIIYRKNVKQ